MTFAWPYLLWLLLFPAALLGWDLSHRRRMAVAARPKILRAEAGAHSLKLSSFEARLAPRKARPRWWLCLGLALCVAALARPQWGRLEEPVFEQSREILLAIDLSRSMLAPDVRPSRLERAKLLIRSLLEKLAGERVGLVVFSGTAFLQAPLSADYEILLEFLPALGPEFLPEGGSNYRAMLDASLGAFVGTAGADRYLIVLSDGEATDDDWKPRAAELKAKGIRVIGLGVGTAAGSMVPDQAGGFIKDERGAVVLTKLESGTLQELAQATGGVYRDASTWVDVAGLLKETIEAGRKGQFVETNTVRLVERYQWPLALGLWFLLVSFYYEFPVRPRPRDIALRASKEPGAKGKVQEKAVREAITVSVMLLLALCASPLARAASADDAALAPPVSPTDAAALAKIVGRLSNAPTQTGRDWAELATETVSWGSKIQSAQQAVPEGPVRDALSAVDVGAKLDAKTADWPKLREELENLLKKPDEQKQEQEQQKQDKDKQNQENPDEKKSDDQKSSDDPQKQEQNQKDAQQKPQEQKQGESAFGDMNQKDSPPPPPPNDTQKVGGTEKKEEPEPVDPSLALPLQKLDQLRNHDSPAQLFQLMEGEKKAPKKPAKDW